MFEKIKVMAREAGFDLVGISDGKSLARLKGLLIERKKKSLESSIEEEDINKRLYPKAYLPTYRSIISLAISYNFPSRADNYFPISKSSQGLDYHIVMEGKLSSLVDRLSREYGGDYFAFSDRVPLLEREIAVDAGIGFYGKNSSVINPTYGSFIYLAGILTDLEIGPSKRLNVDCGTCDLCIKACPSGALSEGVFNPNRCISYLTQRKGALTFEESGLINSLYGCDICQDVCPYNKSALESDGKDFLLDKVPSYDPIDILTMSNKEFQNKYGMIAGSWRGVKALKRNLIINLTNRGIGEYYNEINKIEDENVGVSKAIEYFYKGRFL
ncbi:MAG: tRNA epoxyqueuosine(34) reductase QueG [Tissierellia bacterium]|nr:tRNA epoxyqueuosine(34) reductase QueG [Tissierellia bacterium]